MTSLKEQYLNQLNQMKSFINSPVRSVVAGGV